MTATKRELWLETMRERGNGSLQGFFETKAWKALFPKVLKAPWRKSGLPPRDAVDTLRARVEHHLLNGKATASDALLTALQEDPQLYEQALAANGQKRSPAPARSKPSAKKTATRKRARR